MGHGDKMTRDDIVAAVMKRLDSWAVIGSSETVEGYNTVPGIYPLAKGVIITRLSCTMLANLANGTGGGEEEFIFGMLLEGKPVYIKPDGVVYKSFKSTAPRALYSLYDNCEKKLAAYGIRYLPCGGTVSKKLICVSDLCGVTDITVDRRSIISPLAQDYIKQNNINVIRR